VLGVITIVCILHLIEFTWDQEPHGREILAVGILICKGGCTKFYSFVTIQKLMYALHRAIQINVIF
jgi:hypothetical protein